VRAIAGAGYCRPNWRANLGFTDMAKLSSGLDRISIFWHARSSRYLISSEAILVGRQSIACKLTFSLSRRWLPSEEPVLWSL